MAAAGFDPLEARVKHFGSLFMRVQNLPRHLGQHSGGMVVAKGRLSEVVPLEPAAMEGRVVIQWDKDDCADLGIVKVDLLGLGMLGAIEKTIPMIEAHEGEKVDLAHLPADDPAVYAMLQKADTIGLFQVESRAQMASLPRHMPMKFYDIVVQVAIIRPGPIVGGMVHPFFDRRQGKAPVEYPHPCLEPILKRTLGVPLFQEQLLKIAMVAAGFTGGEAEELRRAMGFKRSEERMGAIETRLRSGMETQRHHGARAGPDRQVDHVLRALRLPRVARGELRAHRVRERVAEGPPSRGVHGVPPERVADGLLPPGDDREGHPEEGGHGPAHRRELLGVGMRFGKRKRKGREEFLRR